MNSETPNCPVFLFARRRPLTSSSWRVRLVPQPACPTCKKLAGSIERKHLLRQSFCHLHEMPLNSKKNSKTPSNSSNFKASWGLITSKITNYTTKSLTKTPLQTLRPQLDELIQDQRGPTADGEIVALRVLPRTSVRAATSRARLSLLTPPGLANHNKQLGCAKVLCLCSWFGKQKQCVVSVSSVFFLDPAGVSLWNGLFFVWFPCFLFCWLLDSFFGSFAWVRSSSVASSFFAGI